MAICTKFVQAAPVQRSSEKPVSLLELSVHARLIWLAEIGVAESPDGADGAGVVPPNHTPRFNRPPVTVTPDIDEVGVDEADCRIAARVCCAVTPGLRALYNAAAPVTFGVAIDVPLNDAYVPLGVVDQIPLPGAPRSTVVAP